MSEGVTFPEIEPSKPLAMNFTMLCYSINMGKQWQSNVVFHNYYLQLKRAIESIPHMTSNNLHGLWPFVKFNADKHFIYITAHRDEHKDVLQGYYKLTKEDLEEITKEWLTELLIPINPEKLFDPNLIESPVVTRKEYDTPGSRRRNKKEEIQELSNTLEETSLKSPGGGGDDKVDKEEEKGEEDKNK
jgi:hypothetical protein